MKIIAATQPAVAYYEDGTRRTVLLWAVNEITLLVVGLVIAGDIIRADSIAGFLGYADN